MTIFDVFNITNCPISPEEPLIAADWLEDNGRSDEANKLRAFVNGCENYILWARIGDADDYHEYDSLEDVAEDLALCSVSRIDRCCQFGVRADGYSGHNYISLFWGPSDPGDGSVEASRELTDEEIEEINYSLEFYPWED